MSTLREDMLKEIENEEASPLTSEDIKSFVEAFTRVSDEMKKERIQSESEVPVTQTLNG